MLLEKDEAVHQVEALQALIEAPPPSLLGTAVAELGVRIGILIRYIKGFRAIGYALVLARASIDGRTIDPADLRRALDALVAEAQAMEDFATSSDHQHVVYTLLSPERLRALHLDLVRHLALGQAA